MRCRGAALWAVPIAVEALGRAHPAALPGTWLEATRLASKHCLTAAMEVWPRAAGPHEHPHFQGGAGEAALGQHLLMCCFQHFVMFLPRLWQVSAMALAVNPFSADLFRLRMELAGQEGAAEFEKEVEVVKARRIHTLPLPPDNDGPIRTAS